MTSVYDQLNPPGADTAYWLDLVDRERPRAVTDLGCGTGLLTVLLAARVPSAVGVDPDPSMLATARARPGGDAVTWVRGTAADLADASTDLVTMTGHVAQVFLTDEHWLADLAHVRRALRPGGLVAFDTRHPAARAWAGWTRARSTRTLVTPGGPAETWHETTAVEDGLVTFDTVTRPADGSPDVVVTDTLRFRDEALLRTTLASAGLTVETVHGDWDASPVTPDSPELLLTARR